MARPLSRLIGRDAELESIAQFIAAVGDGPWAVLLDGEAGIGKTSLWRVAAGRLGESDQPNALVLRTRSTEAESAMTFAGLSDLLASVPTDEFAALPPPQRLALEVATLRALPGDEPIDERAIAMAVANVLTHLAEHQRVVLALDDVQWLDDASRAAIEFVVRRIAGARIGLVATIRSPHERVPLVGAIESTTVPVHTVMVGPLTLAAIHHLVRDELAYVLPRPALLRIAEAAAGNPFFALELARAFQRAGSRLEAGAPLPVPDTLRGLTTERLTALSIDARRSLLLAATAAQPTVAMLRRLDASDGLVEADTAQIVELRGGRVEFTHPLLASAALVVATAPERRVAHAAVASVTDDPEQRARHLALAADGPSEEVAEALEVAVATSRGRGATAAAAELARLALDHTVDPTSDPAMRRASLLGDLLFEAGDAVGAEAQYRIVLDRSVDHARRAHAALQTVEIAFETGRTDCIDLARLALEEAEGDAELTARALLTLAILEGPPKAVDLTRQAREHLESTSAPDPMLLAWAIYQEAANRFNMGEGLDLAAIDRGLALERAGRVWRSTDQVANAHPVLLKFADDFDAARSGLEELRQRAIDEGNDGQLPYIVGHLPVLLLRQGEWDEAARAAADHMELAEATGQEAQVAQAHYNLAAVALYQGRFDAALASAQRMAPFADTSGDDYLIRAAHLVLGAVALQQDDPARAVDHLEVCWRISSDLADDPGVARFQGDLAEALLIRGDAARAKLVIAETEANAARAGRMSVAAVMARSRAHLAAAEGDVTAALVAIDEALSLHDVVPIPFERARTLLLKGQLHRRAKEKRLARDALADALAIFETLGAAHWTAKTQGELDRVNIRPPAPLDLTVTERRIAELAAQGLTNRQIAAAAFVSPKTVEANLARVYRKLGIASRAELGSRMGEGRGA